MGLGLAVPGSGLVGNPDDEGIDYFVRGDTNNDGLEDLSDSLFLLNHLFTGGAAPVCQEVADINDDGAADITDAVFFLRYLFGGEAPPPPPFPGCGPDPNNSRCQQAVCNF